MNFHTYKHIPKKEIKNAAIFSGICIFSAAALITASMFVSNFAVVRLVYRLSAVVFATAAIQITSRFILSDYIYILDKTNFIIVKVNGAKSAQVCNISLETSISVFEKNKKFSEIEKQFDKFNKTNFCQNMIPYKLYVYIFELNQKKSAVIFEPDRNFIAEMQKRMEYAKSDYAKYTENANSD